jgi:hypothetical protein
MTVDAANATGGRSKAMIAGVAAALVLVCAVAAIPVSRKLMRKDAPAAAQPQATSAPAAQTDSTAAGDAANAPLQVNASDAVAAEDAAAAARREQQQREARERARKAREEAAKNAGQDQTLTGAPPKPATPAGAKTVRVQITYDDAGRVTQAAAIGTSPGAEAYASTAVRVARSRHFAPGKAGSTVVTIPIN